MEEVDRLGRAVAARAKTYEGVRDAVLAGIDTIEHRRYRRPVRSRTPIPVRSRW